MAKEKLTKEEMEQLAIERKKLAKSKDKYFKQVCDEAYKEHMDFGNCETCHFLSPTCHMGCGVIMKWMHKSGQIDDTQTFGCRRRVVSAAEHDDITGIIDDETFDEGLPPPEISEEELAEFDEDYEN